MSYRHYINNREIQVSDVKPIAYTKQINDLSRLDSRQSNFTYKFYAPLTPQNVEAMEYVAFVGNQSNLPYQRNRYDLIDTDTGRHLIYNGVAVVSATVDKGYEINTYDGIIDFYKAIENKTLTDAGVTNLNHVKSVANIVASWADTFDYKYILADYNGKMDGSNVGLGPYINADYMVPSARVSYLWDRLHASNGYTYTGAIFGTEKFINHWMTYPKPIPSTSPNVVDITEQTSEPGVQPGLFPYIVNPFPAPFSTPEANNTGQQPGWVNILQTGAYRFNCSGTIAAQGGPVITEFHYRSTDALGQVVDQGTFDPTAGVDVIVNCQAGGKLILIYYGILFFGFATPVQGDLVTSLALVVGYTVNFDQALLDFTQRDFANEIMQHYGLTAFKDRHRKHIVYLTLKEILQNPNVLDWSDKFSGRTSEKYIFGNYGQRNTYKYRYNDENATHNNGYLTINNENLKEEVPVMNSKIYSPETGTNTISTTGLDYKIYKIWDKNPKEDGTIEYKELTGRFYYLRSTDHTFTTQQTIYSEALNTSDNFFTIPIESYYRLPLQQVLTDNYSTIESLLYKSKTLEGFFELSAMDVENFDFKQLIYVKQLGSYYLVNKIMNFIKRKLTKCEIIEVDYFREIEVVPPPDLFLNIDSFGIVGCTATFNVTTNVPQPTTVQIVVYGLSPDGIGGFYYAPVASVEGVPMAGGVVTHTFTNIPPTFGNTYQFQIIHYTTAFVPVPSALTAVETLSGSCYIAPPANLTYITITNVETLSVSGGYRTIRVTYVSDLSVATMVAHLNAVGGLISFPPNIQTSYFAAQNGFIDITVIHQNTMWGGPYSYALTITGDAGTGTVTSNTATSLS